MSGINKVNVNNSKINSYYKFVKNINTKPKSKTDRSVSCFSKATQIDMDKITYNIDPVKRPLKINNRNNIFYINYKGKNKTVKIKPGEYNLTELSRAIQDKVNESFGIGKVQVDLTGSGKDRIVKAKDINIHDILDNNE